jgi:ribonuclease Z
MEAFLSNRDVIILGCSSQQPTRERNHGAYLVRWNEEGFLFDPGEGTQRQFIFAEVAPPTVNRIFVSHFHGDHCLGLGSMLMRLNLDKVTHPIHCYYPASGKKNFDALRYGCIYHENIQVIEHPVSKSGLVEDDGNFIIEAAFLDHKVDNIGWRVTEKDRVKFNKDLLKKNNIQGSNVGLLIKKGLLKINDKDVKLEDVSWIQKGQVLSVVIDTRPCPAALQISKDATVLICESTYTEKHRDLAEQYMHMTAKQAAEIAKTSNVEMLILTHFSARYRDVKEFEDEAKQVFENTYVAEDFKRFNFPSRYKS